MPPEWSPETCLWPHAPFSTIFLANSPPPVANKQNQEVPQLAAGPHMTGQPLWLDKRWGPGGSVFLAHPLDKASPLDHSPHQHPGRSHRQHMQPSPTPPLPPLGLSTLIGCLGSRTLACFPRPLVACPTQSLPTAPKCQMPLATRLLADAAGPRRWVTPMDSRRCVCWHPSSPWHAPEACIPAAGCWPGLHSPPGLGSVNPESLQRDHLHVCLVASTLLLWAEGDADLAGAGRGPRAQEKTQMQSQPDKGVKC